MLVKNKILKDQRRWVVKKKLLPIERVQVLRRRFSRKKAVEGLATTKKKKKKVCICDPFTETNEVN